MQNHFDDMVREVDRFLVGTSKVHAALDHVARALEESGVEFALGGGLALGEHGYVRVTVDVDLLVTAEGLERFKSRWLGRGFAESHPDSRRVRETETGVPIDFLLAGDYPGDGRPKSVRFPDPASIARGGGRLRVLDLRTLIELKLASGISAPDRLRDLADVLELVRANRLGETYAERLDQSVRVKYLEIWRAAQAPRRDL
ncbi:MAG TPA: hypothetical protein VGK89_09380 [Candidatus Eisenbacteria bacterium]|jgi:hypothetical protein